MEFEAYWKKLVVQNPGLRDGDTRMTISVLAFRRALARSYEAGNSESAGKRKAAEDFERASGKKNPLGDFLGMFKR